MSFRPNINALLEPVAQETDAYGQKSFGAAVTVRCASVSLKVKSEKTSVRADSSASGGQAEETLGTARFLFLPGVVKLDDRVTVLGVRFRVLSVFPRISVGGKHDHDEVDCEAWD